MGSRCVLAPFLLTAASVPAAFALCSAPGSARSRFVPVAKHSYFRPTTPGAGGKTALGTAWADLLRNFCDLSCMHILRPGRELREKKRIDFGVGLCQTRG